jgi:ribonuclease P protein component
MGLSKIHRVVKNEEFQRIIGAKNYVTNAAFSLYYAVKYKDTGRYGISVGKKLGGAVERNKVKRQVRMMISELSEFNETFDVIIMVRQGYLKQDYVSNKKDLENSLNKVRIKVPKTLNKEMYEKVIK